VQPGAFAVHRGIHEYPACPGHSLQEHPLKEPQQGHTDWETISRKKWMSWLSCRVSSTINAGRFKTFIDLSINNNWHSLFHWHQITFGIFIIYPAFLKICLDLLSLTGAKMISIAHAKGGRYPALFL
jgi:hypothetical protein